jgi:hypothetical protein
MEVMADVLVGWRFVLKAAGEDGVGGGGLTKVVGHHDLRFE